MYQQNDYIAQSKLGMYNNDIVTRNSIIAR
jgi:hypothetical protein